MATGSHWLDIVPRGPRRWHRLAQSHVNHPHWKGSELYAQRLAAAQARLAADPLPEAGAYQHHDSRYEWSREFGSTQREVHFYTCSPLCAYLTETTRGRDIVRPVEAMPKRSRCETCGKTRTSDPLFNVAAPTQADADAYSQWWEERVAWKQGKDAAWREQSAVRRVAAAQPVQPLTGVVQPPATNEWDRFIDVLVDDQGNIVQGQLRQLQLTAKELELFRMLSAVDRFNYAAVNGTVLHAID